MNVQKVWTLLVSFLLVCGMIGCGEKPEPVAKKPKAVPEEPKAVVSEPDVTEEPKSPTKKPAVAKWQLPPGAPPPAIAPFDADQAKLHQQAWAEYLGVPGEITNSIGMKLVLIPSDEFLMGSPEDEENREKDEHQHRVRITKPFLSRRVRGDTGGVRTCDEEESELALTGRAWERQSIGPGYKSVSS